jgi:hypothetical protein
MQETSDPLTPPDAGAFWRPLLGLCACALALRVVFLILFDNVYSVEAEAYSKINLLAIWSETPDQYPDLNFGPLHTWLLYVLVRPFEAPVLPARLLSVVCGSLVLIPFAHTVRLVFGARPGLVAAALLAVMPLHLRGSATSLALAPYNLFLMCGLYFHLRYQLRSGTSFRFLIAAAAFMTLACMLRFDAWLFLPPLCLFLLRRNLLHAIGFGAMCLVFPAIHMYVSHYHTGDWTSFATTSANTFAYLHLAPLNHKLFGWASSFQFALTTTTLGLAALGVFFAAFKRKGFYFVALFSFSFGIFLFKSLTNTTDPAIVRYTSAMCLMVLPFAAYLLTAVGDRIGRLVGAPRAGLIPFVVALMAQSVLVAGEQSQDAGLPDDAWATVLDLRERAGPEATVLPDARFHPFFVIESRIPRRQLVQFRVKDHTAVDFEDLERLIRETPPTLVVLDYNAKMNALFISNLSAFDVAQGAETAVSHGLRFELLATHGDFSVYATRPESDP